ncbi:MAG TPA: branched-chain amino acid ABC transporter permease/ATP-binding protein [Candidatus Dormibacteraeota bacterium]|nr:branched-chain amino acid ABC transporter permease/ATP-binding protein [Candidatus Dormibacteraeota bacterium]
MSEYLPFIIVGIATGAVYALAGVGLVLTYKTSGIFNLAHGALGTAAAYLFYTLHVQHGVAWPLAAAISVLVLGPILGIGFERFGRSLSRTTVVWRIASTAAILISIEALFTILYGTSELTFGHFLPNETFTIFGAGATWEQLIVVLISIVATLGLSVYFRVTRTGKAMRAVVDDPDLLDLAGTNPVAVRRWAWIIGCAFATLSGLLLAPDVELDPTVLTLLIVQAFGAAAIGGFSSIPMTWAGGIGIGIVAALISKVGPSGSILAGLSPSLPFVVLFLVLVFSPRTRLLIKDVGILRRPITWKAPARSQWAFGGIVLAVFLAAPAFAGFNLSQWTLALTDVIMFLSLGLLLRTSGQVSLCQVAFAAIGAAYFSKLAVDAHVPWMLALLICGLVVVPVGALLAIPAIRFSGLYLALATFGFGVLLQDMFYNTDYMFGFGGNGVTVPLPAPGSWFSTDAGYYYLVLGITVALALLTVLLVRSRLGRLLSGISDSRLALSVQGTSVTVTLVVVFCISAFMAAISGALGAAVLTNVGGDNYSPLISLTFVAMVMILPGTAPWYAIVGGLSLALLPIYIPSTDTLNYMTLTFGASVVLIALRGHPAQFRWLKRKIDGSWFGRRPAPALPAGQSGAGAERRTRIEPVTLEVQHVTMRFGGLVAVSDANIEIPSGRITGLIGPNGAGKSTVINICSGILRPSGGDVLFNGRSLLGMSPAARARLGIGRTFQQMELFESLSVRENVALGREGALAGADVLGQFVGKPGDHETIETNVARAIERCGLQAVAEVQVSELSTGQRRLVELARCLAGPFQVLLLDEPSSGLDRRETEQLGRILRAELDETGGAVLLVEHDMSLVMSVCDEIWVMDFGRVIFQGSPEAVRNSEAVRSAYLGEPVKRPERSAALQPEGLVPS